MPRSHSSQPGSRSGGRAMLVGHLRHPQRPQKRTFALDKLRGRGLASQRASALSIRGPRTSRRTPGEGEFPPAFESDERFFETREGDGGRRWRAARDDVGGDGVRLESKVALITGGYGGMGRASARLFAQEGATVFVAGRNQERGDALVKELNDAAGTAHFVELDVVDQDQWDAAVAQVKEQAGALHVLMNIVGSNALVRLPHVDIDEWNKIFEINVTGTLRGIQTCAPLIKDSGGGSIVNIGSVAGITGNFSSGYSSSKWALEGLSRSAAYVYSDWGIRSNVIQPGWIETDMTAGDVEPDHQEGTGACPQEHRAPAPQRQGGGHRLRGPVPGQRRVLLHHRHGHRGRRRLVLVRALPGQRALPSRAEPDGQEGAPRGVPSPLPVTPHANPRTLAGGLAKYLCR